MRKLTVLIFVSLFAITLLAGCVPHSTGDTEVGVRTNKIGLLGKKGVEEKYYAPGSTYFFLPFVTDWHTFDTKLQTGEFGMIYYLRLSTAMTSALMLLLLTGSTLIKLHISCKMLLSAMLL